MQFKDDNNEWVSVLQVRPCKHGQGLFALQEYAIGDCVSAYFGTLAHVSEKRKGAADMVMQSALKDYVIEGSPATDISGAVFVNDVRGEKRRKQNVKISLRYQRQDKPLPTGSVLPIYRCISRIKADDEILTNYNWTEEEWAYHLTCSKE